MKIYQDKTGIYQKRMDKYQGRTEIKDGDIYQGRAKIYQESEIYQCRTWIYKGRTNVSK